MQTRPSSVLGPVTTALIVALLVRLALIAFEIPIGRDIIEYQNAAWSLGEGRGLTLDIRAYYASETPVIHYATYERPPMFPILLWLGSIPLGLDWASRLLPPALFLIALALITDALRAWLGPRTAFWAGLALALHPGLLGVSLRPLTEVAVLLGVALALWGHIRAGKSWVVGLACAFAFLARPSAALMGVIFGIVYLRRLTRGDWRALAAFAPAALIGPAALVWMNIAAGAPALLTPQAFLFRVLRAGDFVHEFHRAPLYASPAALLASEGSHAARQIAKNAFYYAQTLLTDVDSLIVLIPVMALAGIGLTGIPRRSRAFLLATIAAADLGLYVITWSTYDADRFLSVTWLALVTLIVIGAVAGAERFSGVAGGIPSRLTPVLLLPILTFWGGVDLWRGYIAWRESGQGRPYSNFYEPILVGADIEVLRLELKKMKALGELDEGALATDEPWRAWLFTERPAALLPFDLKKEEWLPFLDKLGARQAALQESLWPETYRANLDELRQELKSAGWKLRWSSDGFEVWAAPDEFTPTAVAQSESVRVL